MHILYNKDIAENTILKDQNQSRTHIISQGAKKQQQKLPNVIYITDKLMCANTHQLSIINAFSPEGVHFLKEDKISDFYRFTLQVFNS